MKRMGTILLLLPLIASCATPSKAELDAEVKRLCAIDGGIKVYETVKLPADKFNEYGQVNFWIPIREKAKPSDEYFYEWDIHYYRQGNPELSRGHFKVTRKKDSKLLGESVYYGRGGGDLPGPWHGTSFRCPSDSDISILKMRIFVRSDWGLDK